MHLILELKTTKDLSSVLLEHPKLVDDLLVTVALSADLVELVVEAKVLQAGQELSLLLFGWCLVDDKVDEAEVELVQVQVDGALELAAYIEGPLSGFHDLGLHSVECRTEQTFVNEESDRQLGLLLVRQ